MSFQDKGVTYSYLTLDEVRLITDYDTWARKSGLALILDKLAMRDTFIGSYVNAAAVNAVGHPRLGANVFVPGDRYYDTTATSFYTNTALTVGAATWTAG